jgi:hypothetical protein
LLHIGPLLDFCSTNATFASTFSWWVSTNTYLGGSRAADSRNMSAGYAG